MNTLPSSPDLAHLKKQAKHLLRDALAGEALALARFVETLPAVRGLSLAQLAGRNLKLHDAQSVVAREYGFRSWPELKVYVEWKMVDRASRLDTWLKWAYDGNARERRLAVRMLREEPEFFAGDARLACAVGNVDGVRAALAMDAGWANRVSGEPMAMPPLCGVTHSLLILEDGFADGLMECARVLTAAGADVDGVRVLPDCKLSAVYGAAGKTHHAGMTRLLLEVGANPDDDESLYHSAEEKGSACTRLLLEFGARVVRTNAMGRCMDFDKPDDLRLMLEHGGEAREKAWVHHAILRGRSMVVIRILVNAGADLRAHNEAGESLYRYAQMHGRQDVVALLLEAGVTEDLTVEEEFIAACTRGDEAAARAFGPDMPGRLNRRQIKALPEMAEVGNMAAVGVMIGLGWPLEVVSGWGATALNHAVYRGDAVMAKMLLDAGADWRTQHAFKSDVRGTLSWASQNESETPVHGDFVGCAQVLVEHGVALDEFRFSEVVEAYLDGVRLGVLE